MCRKSKIRCGRLLYLTFFFTLVLGLANGQAWGQYRAAYWDGRYRTWWADEAITVAIRDEFEAAGYEILDADQLKTWMNARIADEVASVVVFCRDNAPDTVVEWISDDCTLRGYLDAGGKIVWYSDIPLWEIAHSDGTFTYLGGVGCANILGISGVDWTNSTGSEVTLTDDGIDWGLTETWRSERWTPANQVDIVLASDSAGHAAAWVKHFVPGDTTGGFVRIWDIDVTPDNRPSFADLLAVAEYGLEGYPYARGPSPADAAVYLGEYVSCQWLAGCDAVSHDVYFGDNYADVAAGTGGSFRCNRLLTETYLVVGLADCPYPDGLVPGATYYWRIDEVNDLHPDSPWKGNIWSFSIPSEKATAPIPADGARFIDLHVTLSWTAGIGVAVHHVYFGDNPDDVAASTPDTDKGTFGAGTTTYWPGPLEHDKTYYWRVDEVVARQTHKGDIWSFTTARAGGGLRADYYHHDGGTPHVPPEGAFSTFVLTRIDPQINFNWGQGSPDASINIDDFSAIWTGEVEAAFTETYTFYTTADDGVMLWVDGQLIVDSWTDQSATEHSGTIDLVAGSTYPIEMWFYERAVDAVAELRWSGPRTPKQLIPSAALSPPLRASGPTPANGAAGVKMTPTLTWDPGDFAASHRVYFGTSENAVRNATTDSPEYRGTRALGSESYEPGELTWDTSYYWRVDQVNDLNPDSPWVGNVWNFATADFLIIDDFEDYDADNNQIWLAWQDGIGYGAPGASLYSPGNGTGSTMGDETTESHKEESITHGGSRQAMPYWYNNNKPDKFKYSEAKMTMTARRDWTAEGVKALSLWFCGRPASTGSFVEAPAGTYTMTASGADIWDLPGLGTGFHDEFHFAYKQLTGAGTIIAKVEGVEYTHDWAKAGVMIRETLDADSAHAFACITPASGVAFQGRPYTGSASFSATQTGINAPHWLKLERDISDNFIVSHSSDGLTWEVIQNDMLRNIQMLSNVYVGLAVTSHDAALTCEAVFSNVTIPGDADGEWTHRDIGIESNEAQPMYVAIANSTGTPVVSYNKNPDAAVMETWTRWPIDLKDFEDQGIDLTDVNSIAIGFGDRDNPVAGGAGKVYFDDIALYQPRYIPGKGTPLAADINSDGIVDASDLEIMAGDWLAGDSDIAVDLNADGTVDFKDYAVLAEAWLDEQLWPEW
jgi:hypothetical protein